jgi:hypothetical protein
VRPAGSAARAGEPGHGDVKNPAARAGDPALRQGKVGQGKIKTDEPRRARKIDVQRLTFWVGDRNKIDCTQLHNREGRANQPGFVVLGEVYSLNLLRRLELAGFSKGENPRRLRPGRNGPDDHLSSTAGSAIS